MCFREKTPEDLAWEQREVGLLFISLDAHELTHREVISIMDHTRDRRYGLHPMGHRGYGHNDYDGIPYVPPTHISFLEVT